MSVIWIEGTRNISVNRKRGFVRLTNTVFEIQLPGEEKQRTAELHCQLCLCHKRCMLHSAKTERIFLELSNLREHEECLESLNTILILRSWFMREARNLNVCSCSPRREIFANERGIIFNVTTNGFGYSKLSKNPSCVFSDENAS